MRHIRLCGARTLTCAVSIALLLPARAAPWAPSQLLHKILQQAGIDSDCAQIRVLGQCYCAGLPCGLRVQRYVPVAIVETTRAPGDSVLGSVPIPVPPGLGGLGTVSSLESATDNTAEAHVWTLPGASLPGWPCAACNAASAARPAARVAAQSGATAAACGAASAVAQALGTGAAFTAAAGLPALAYSSEIDWFNWRTGCRDLVAADLVPALPGIACDGAPSASMPSSTAAPADACIGHWGPLRPRQMRDIGPPPPLYAAKTAVRAMSIARDQLGNFAYPVDTSGKLQQVYPALSACFAVGSLPLPQLPASARPVVTSADGRYAWIYWRLTSCCVGLSSAALCLRPPGP
jgi:hypothetical protein